MQYLPHWECPHPQGHADRVSAEACYNASLKLSLVHSDEPTIPTIGGRGEPITCSQCGMTDIEQQSDWCPRCEPDDDE
jgi:hypothetical protein